MLSIIFDVDDTLYSRADIFWEALQQVFPQHAAAVEKDILSLFQAFIRQGNAVFDAAMAGEITMETMHILRFQRAIAEFGISVTDEEALLFQKTYLWHQEHMKARPEVLDMLQMCEDNGIFTAIITNGPNEHQRIKYRALGVNRIIPEDRVITSGEVGTNKPQPECFYAAVEKWNLNLADTWYVGDSYAHDIVGARNAGWKTIWLNRYQEPVPDQNMGPEDYQAADIEELTSLIKKLKSRRIYD